MSSRALVQRLDNMITRFDRSVAKRLQGGAAKTSDVAHAWLEDLSLLREIRETLHKNPNINVQMPYTGKPGPRGPIMRGQHEKVERPLRKAEKTLLGLIDADPGHAWATAEILHTTQMREKTMKEALTHLVRDGYLVRIRRGFYRSIHKPSDDGQQDSQA